MVRIRHVALCILVAAGAAADPRGQKTPADHAPATVVFVCQRGAAKSLIAAAYFNKMAAERGMRERASFRAISPQEAVSSSVVAGLAADGVPVPPGSPTAIGPDDVAAATHVFAMGCDLPAAVAASGKSISWTDIPSDRGYPPMRDAVVARVSRLLDELQRRAP